MAAQDGNHAVVLLVALLASYFVVTSGIIYDILTKTPSMGQEVDSKGNALPVIFHTNKVNSQYILEGLAAAFMFLTGGLGFILLDRAAEGGPSSSSSLGRKSVGTSGSRGRLWVRTVRWSAGFGCCIMGFACSWMFFKKKMPNYQLMF